MPVIQIPWRQLSEEALHGLIEEFVTRDGTDYGREELNTATKSQRLRQQIEAETALIVFDEESESCQIVSRDEFEQQNPI